MGGSGKKIKLPPAEKATDPVPDPVPIDVETQEKERARRRQRLRKFGRGGTILTSGGLGTSEAEQKKSTLLGGAA